VDGGNGRGDVLHHVKRRELSGREKCPGEEYVQGKYPTAIAGTR